MADITPAEYEDRRRRLEADYEDAKRTLQNARGRFDRIADELRNLRIDYQEQQRAKEKPNA